MCKLPGHHPNHAAHLLVRVFLPSSETTGNPPNQGDTPRPLAHPSPPRSAILTIATPATTTAATRNAAAAATAATTTATAIPLQPNPADHPPHHLPSPPLPPLDPCLVLDTQLTVLRPLIFTSTVRFPIHPLLFATSHKPPLPSAPEHRCQPVAPLTQGVVPLIPLLAAPHSVPSFPPHLVQLPLPEPADARDVAVPVPSAKEVRILSVVVARVFAPRVLFVFPGSRSMGK